MKNLMEKSVLTTLGTWLLIHEVADDFIRDMISKGKEEASEKRRALEELSIRVEEEKDEIKEKIGELMGQVMSDMGAVTSDDLKEFEKKLAALERRVKKLEQSD